jgi:YHS domain-containing protein
VIRALLIGLLVLLVARAFWRLVDGILEAAGGTGSRDGSRSPAVRLVRDPVCGTYVSPGNALSLTAGGNIHHFCSEQCRAEFQRRT